MLANRAAIGEYLTKHNLEAELANAVNLAIKQNADGVCERQHVDRLVETCTPGSSPPDSPLCRHVFAWSLRLAAYA